MATEHLLIFFCCFNSSRASYLFERRCVGGKINQSSRNQGDGEILGTAKKVYNLDGGDMGLTGCFLPSGSDVYGMSSQHFWQYPGHAHIRLWLRRELFFLDRGDTNRVVEALNDLRGYSHQRHRSYRRRIWDPQQMVAVQALLRRGVAGICTTPVSGFSRRNLSPVILVRFKI